MIQTITLNNSIPSIGFYSRLPIVGDEYTLVNKFIDYYCFTFKDNNKISQLAVFVEPRIDSGYPDIVFASYRPSIMDNWSYSREVLDVNDLKLLSYLAATQTVLEVNLISTLGFSEKQTITSLEKLLDANLVVYRYKKWRISDKKSVFSVTKLIAVEAKLNSINKVLQQTILNTRFASHSYALTNTIQPQSETIKKLKKFGIGLYCQASRFRKLVEAKQHYLPSSYLCFQFNEWIGKSLAHSGKIHD